MRRTMIAIGAALVVLAGCGAGEAATSVVYVAPVDANGDPVEGLAITRTVHGHCEPGSDSVPGPTYRCFFGNYIADPCWVDATTPGSVLCMTQPWAKTAIRLFGSILEYSFEPVPKRLNYPWGVELSTGERCVALQGAHDEYRRRVVDYSCGIDYVGRVLLRGMHFTQPLWSFDSAFWTGKKYLPRARVTARVAWYGGPSPEH